MAMWYRRLLPQLLLAFSVTISIYGTLGNDVQRVETKQNDLDQRSSVRLVKLVFNELTPQLYLPNQTTPCTHLPGECVREQKFDSLETTGESDFCFRSSYSSIFECSEKYMCHVRVCLWSTDAQYILEILQVNETIASSEYIPKESDAKPVTQLVLASYQIGRTTLESLIEKSRWNPSSSQAVHSLSPQELGLAVGIPSVAFVIIIGVIILVVLYRRQSSRSLLESSESSLVRQSDVTISL